MMNSIRQLNTSGITRALLYVLIFFQPFNHFNSFREISFYALCAVLLVRIFKGELKHIIFKDKTMIALSLLTGWCLLVSLIGPYFADSLDAIRKNLFKEVVIFLVIIIEFKSLRDLRPLFWIVVSSFAALTFASIIENAINDWDTFRKLVPSISWRSVSTYFYARYPNKATFYLPFIAIWIVSIKEASWKKWIGALTLIPGFVLVYIYNGRTPLVAVVLAFFIIMLLAKKYKIVGVFIIAAVLSISIVAASKSDGFSRYKTLLDPTTYTSDAGLTGRLGLWQVVIEIIEERPLTGYGYGWKKLAWLAEAKNSDEFWENYLPSARSYFLYDAKLEYGRVNPHNLLLQIMFEIGLIGLAIFLWLWSTVVHKMVKTIRAVEPPESKTFMLCAFGLLLSYGLINVTNGYWQEAYGNMIFLFMASVFVMHREAVSVSREVPFLHPKSE